MEQIKVKTNGTQAILGPVRVSFVHLFEKYNPENYPDGGKYCLTVMIPKTDKAALEALKTCYQNAVALGAKKWDGASPNAQAPFKNGDEKSKYEELAGHILITPKSGKKVPVFALDRSAITDPDAVYSGMWALVNLDFYPYKASGSRGVAVALNSVLKVKDSERFGGGDTSASAFDGLGIDAPADSGLGDMADLI